MDVGCKRAQLGGTSQPAFALATSHKCKQEEDPGVGSQESTEKYLLISYASPREDSLNPLGFAEQGSKKLLLCRKEQVSSRSTFENQ
jgi:hypothetical protein